MEIELLGSSERMRAVRARLLHRLSPRRDGPFIECHANSVVDDLEVSELAGYARGSFTGAYTDRVGDVEAAHGGTLFVDEVGTATPRTQLALLQLVEGYVKRIGEQRMRKVDVRVVFATNVDLARRCWTG